LVSQEMLVNLKSRVVSILFGCSCCEFFHLILVLFLSYVLEEFITCFLLVLVIM